jgi:hypothetical protein
VPKDRVIVDVDARGRVSLARFGVKSTQLVVDRLPDGGLVLHQAIALTAAEAAHYRDPAAMTALDRGLGDAKAGRFRSGGLRSDPTGATAAAE